ncbi:MAG TPA: hypothetical protein VF941_17970 [Clostridia bacterium]
MHNAVDYQDLLMFLVFCVVITAGVFLIIMVYHLTAFFKKLNRVFDQNSDNINKTLTILPELVKNSNEVAVGLKVGITGIEDVVGETASVLGDGVDSILDFTKIVGSVVSVILNVFKGK